MPPVFPWRLWCAIAALTIIFFSFTLTSSVPVWTDDSFIVEFGRVTLARAQPVFSFHQRSDLLRPVYSYALLGDILQELAYRVTAPSNLGPRVTALLGQIAAAGFLVYYLRLRGLNTRVSVLLGLALLIDPLCDISWRGGRVDGYAFALLFASLSAIRRAQGWPRGDRGAWPALFLGGTAAAAGILCWPSFLMLSPLIAWELLSFFKQHEAFLLPMCLFTAGGTLAAAVVIVPFYREFTYGIADAQFVTGLGAKLNRGDGLRVQLLALFWSFALTPAVAVAGLCALGKRGNRFLLAGFLLALLAAFDTKMYRLRVLYLLPYLYLAVASLFYRDNESARWQRARAWTIGLMLFAGAGFTVAGTTLSGLSDRSGKNALALIEPARAAVGSGPVRVYTRETDLYFAGRALGWQQFYCFDGCWGPGISTQIFQDMLSRMDVAIYRDGPEPLTREVIEKLGFRLSTVILPEGGHQSSLFGWSYGPRSYGPYFVYRRSP